MEDDKEAVANVFCEFLEVAFHCLLFQKEVYPTEIFERRRKYNIAVHMSRAQPLNDYIGEVLVQLKTWLIQGKLDRVSLVFVDEEEIAQERIIFQFDIKKFVNSDESIDFQELENNLRGFLIKLTTDSEWIKRPEENEYDSFRIVIYTTEEDFSFWDFAPENHVNIPQAGIVALKSFKNVEGINFQVWLEKKNED